MAKPYYGHAVPQVLCKICPDLLEDLFDGMQSCYG